MIVFRFTVIALFLALRSSSSSLWEPNMLCKSVGCEFFVWVVGVGFMKLNLSPVVGAEGFALGGLGLIGGGTSRFSCFPRMYTSLSAGFADSARP